MIASRFCWYAAIQVHVMIACANKRCPGLETGYSNDERFFAALRMTRLSCHSERSEESLVIYKQFPLKGIRRVIWRGAGGFTSPGRFRRRRHGRRLRDGDSLLPA